MLGQQRQGVAQGAQHGLVVRIGGEHTPAQGVEIELLIPFLERAEQGAVVAVAGLLLFVVHLLQHLQKEQVGDLGDVGDGVGDVVVPHHLTEGFKGVLQLTAVHQ